MRAKRLILGVLVIALAAADLSAQSAAQKGVKSTIINTQHDLRAVTGSPDATLCSFCHAAHQAPSAAAVDPLWNHLMSAQTEVYGVYESPTMEGQPEELLGGTTDSNLCLSCHDGTVAINALYTQGLVRDSTQAFASSVTEGTGLTDDHPVNFDYITAASQDPGIRMPADELRWVDEDRDIPLFDAKLQCSSCHDAHSDLTDEAGNQFQRRGTFPFGNICLECHL